MEGGRARRSPRSARRRLAHITGRLAQTQADEAESARLSPVRMDGRLPVVESYHSASAVGHCLPHMVSCHLVGYQHLASRILRFLKKAVPC